MPNFDNELQTILNEAVKESLNQSLPVHTMEMEFLYLIDNIHVQKALALTSVQQSVSIDAMNKTIHTVLKKYLSDENFFPKEKPKTNKQNQIWIPRVPSFEPFYAFMAQRLQATGKNVITPIDYTMAMLHFIMQTNSDRLVSLLAGSEIDVRILMRNIIKVMENPNIEVENTGVGLEGDGLTTENESSAQKEFEKFCVDYLKEAENGAFGPIIGRAKEIETVITTLARKKKNNPILLGEAGVGKTAIAEALAQRIYNQEVPDILKNATLYSLDIGAMMADTRFRGDVEARMKLLINQLEKDVKNDKKPILFIDEIHMIIGAGGVGTSMDVGNMLKPIMTKGHIRFFGATTEQEYRSIIEKDKAIERRFNKVEVKEPSIEDATLILEGVKKQYEEHHKVEYTKEAISQAIKLSVKFIQERKLPDKAIDLIDYAGALQHVAKEENRKEVIDVNEIELALASMVKVPVQKVSAEEKKKLSHLEKELGSVIYGQEEAVQLVADTVMVSSAKLGNPNKPIGSFLFVGPTGVGKTELVKQLSEKMSMPMFRFDMSEYKEPHKVSLLLGSPPGYVGSDKGGDLTEKVYKNPHCVVLLDEIEKAHHSIYDVFLQVMDNGKLTDAQGREIDFRHVVFVMTSNAGSSNLANHQIGFMNGDIADSDVMQGVKETFRPEFINRLDAVVPFKQLDKTHVNKVANKFLMALSTNLFENYAIDLMYNDSVINWLSEKGYDAVMGARPMERVINKEITIPLSKALLGLEKEDIEKLQNAEINIKKDKLDFQLK